MKEMLKDIHDELVQKKSQIALKTHAEVEAMKKQELKYELKRILPEYYISRLVPFRDSR